jgi:hypothetical protein
MSKILLNINYTPLPKFKKYWMDSYIKNNIITLKDGETIHQAIKRVCEEEGMELCYKAKPNGNVYRDGKLKGSTKIVGYLYTGKTEILGKQVLFDVWTIIHGIDESFEFEELN